MLMNPTALMFAKTNPKAIAPSKRVEDGAYDLYACFEEDFMLIPPHETCLIPTGIATVFTSKYVAIIKERGSSGSNGMGVRAGVIDSGYRGQWFTCLTNHNDKPLFIAKNEVSPDVLRAALPEGFDFMVYPYEKAIAQFIMVEVPQLELQEIPYETLQSYPSERGDGALGSSGK